MIGSLKKKGLKASNQAVIKHRLLETGYYPDNDYQNASKLYKLRMLEI